LIVNETRLAEFGEKRQETLAVFRRRTRIQDLGLDLLQVEELTRHFVAGEAQTKG
jgi:hypothetical protein